MMIVMVSTLPTVAIFLTGITRRKYVVRVRNDSESLSQDLGLFGCATPTLWR
ncbi:MULTISPECIES: hypothetical protein [unclassified Microcoleus]|uniref:hypothetical protein n=1 Tax=unclassified Microcoleus TaxID=2642155 RepID=UPI002FD1ED1F